MLDEPLDEVTALGREAAAHLARERQENDPAIVFKQLGVGCLLVTPRLSERRPIASM